MITKEEVTANKIYDALRNNESIYNKIVEFSKTGKSYEWDLTSKRVYGTTIKGFLNLSESKIFNNIVNSVDDSLSGFSFNYIMRIIDKRIKQS